MELIKYEEKLEEFLHQIADDKELSQNIGKLYAPHLPGFGENYLLSEKKILYIGIETNGWFTFDDTLLLENGKTAIEKYIQYSINCIKGYKFLIWMANSAFWEFILKFQFKLYEIGYDDFLKTWNQPKSLKEIIEKISSKNNNQFYDPLQSFAWANTNSIEDYKNQTENKQIWKKIKEKSQNIFDKLTIMIEILKPKLVIILNGSVPSGSNFFDNLFDDDVDKKKWESESVDKFIQYYKYKKADTHLIQTYHPSYMKRIKSLEEYVEDIFNLIKKKGILSMPLRLK